MLILPNDEGKQLAQHIDKLRDVSFAVVCKPLSK